MIGGFFAFDVPYLQDVRGVRVGSLLTFVGMQLSLR
jgi:hypothetical protein